VSDRLHKFIARAPNRYLTVCGKQIIDYALFIDWDNPVEYIRYVKTDNGYEFKRKELSMESYFSLLSEIAKGHLYEVVESERLV
jgi:hypothetical protein